ncbi:TonB-dependent receptor domain-containing protein, partial [Candidatus Synechococcus spongiarum]|uniref:TonB-dependent receptor domain-containing protein n=1 Tax=Candidatus Synechococcus spongiarum TaxID=431041 RepID=UPI0011780346
MVILPAFAQEEPIELDPIVISGGKEKVVSDTPQSVSVLNQNELDRKQPTTVGNGLTDLPGVKAFGSNRVLGEAFNIRGFGQDNSGGEGRLILQVDGATKYYQQYRMGALFTDPELYKRVEVLRGPASSTLYGSGALAGVVTLETKDASDFLKDDDRDFALRQKLEMTSNGYGGFSSTILASRPTKNLEFLGAFIYRNNDDLKDGSGEQIRGSAFDAPSALLKSRYEFGDGNSQAIELSYQHWTTQEDEAEYEQTGTGSFGLVDREVTDKTVVLIYENTPLESDLIDFKARLSWSDTRVIQENAKNTLPPPFDTSVLFDDSTYAYENYQLSFENTSIFGLEEGLQTFLTAGVQGSWQTRTGEAERGFIRFQPGGKDTKVAAFVQTEMVFPNIGLTLIPGLRVEHAALTSDALNTNPNFNETVTNTAVSPKLAALFEINNNWSLFGSVAYTERLPVLDEIFDGASGNLELDAETGITYEIGTTYAINDIFVDNDALVTKLTVFRNDTENLIERASQRDPFIN